MTQTARWTNQNSTNALLKRKRQKNCKPITRKLSRTKRAISLVTQLIWISRRIVNEQTVVCALPALQPKGVKSAETVESWQATPHRTCGTRMKLGVSGRPCLKNPYRREGSVVEVGKTLCSELQLLSLWMQLVERKAQFWSAKVKSSAAFRS